MRLTPSASTVPMTGRGPGTGTMLMECVREVSLGRSVGEGDMSVSKTAVTDTTVEGTVAKTFDSIGAGDDGFWVKVWRIEVIVSVVDAAVYENSANP